MNAPQLNAVYALIEGGRSDTARTPGLWLFTPRSGVTTLTVMHALFQLHELQMSVNTSSVLNDVLHDGGLLSVFHMVHLHNFHFRVRPFLARPTWAYKTPTYVPVTAKHMFISPFI